MTYLMLGIDTATPVTTVALMQADIARGTADNLDERSHRDPRRHGEVLPKLISAVLSSSGHVPSDLDEIAVGVGPGAYTGLRVGVATAQGLGLALDIPVAAVVTLDAIAFASGRSGRFAVVTDARRRELFAAHYLDFRTPDGEATVGAPDVVASALDGRPVLAPSETPPLPGVQLISCGEPSAASVCSLVMDRRREGLPTAPVVPVYLRRPDVTASAGPKSVL